MKTQLLGEKKIKEKKKKVSLSAKSITLKNFIKKKRLINIAFRHCFDVTLAGFEQILNNCFTQLGTE